MLHWIEEAQKGDAEAFRQLIEYVRGMAYAVSYDLLKDVQLAEDAVQEAFIEAYVNLRNLREPEAFPGWFKTIVVRQCHRILRRKHQAMLPLENVMHLTGQLPGVAELAERREWEHVLHSSVAELSDKLRVPLQLFYFYGYSLQEISAYLEIPVPVLKKRLFDGRRKLKGALPVANLAAAFNLMDQGGKRMLHIVNGDMVGEMLKQGIVQGDVLVWREIYSSGPVFAGPSGDGELLLRAEVLHTTLGIPMSGYIARCEKQEHILRGFNQYDEVVLWFEHDLFDQSMLAYLLHWFNGQKLGKTKLSLLCIGEFPGIERFHGLGQLTPAQLKTLSGTWQNIGPMEMNLGSELWEAYASPEPRRMEDVLEARQSELAECALSFANDAFKAHLARLPSVYNGLGIVEQTTLQALADGTDTPLELFRQVTDSLHVLGMGDLEYWKYLHALAAGGQPLISIDGTADGMDFREIPGFLNRKVLITALGEKVRNGAADRVMVQGIDEWYGGLHLQGNEVPWRWDTSAEKLIRV